MPNLATAVRTCWSAVGPRPPPPSSSAPHPARTRAATAISAAHELGRGTAAGYPPGDGARSAPRWTWPPDLGLARVGDRPLQLPLSVLHARGGPAMAGALRRPQLRGDRAHRRAAGPDG